MSRRKPQKSSNITKKIARLISSFFIALINVISSLTKGVRKFTRSTWHNKKQRQSPQRPSLSLKSWLITTIQLPKIRIFNIFKSRNGLIKLIKKELQNKQLNIFLKKINWKPKVNFSIDKKLLNNDKYSFNINKYVTKKRLKQIKKFSLTFFLTIIFILGLNGFNTWFTSQRAIAQLGSADLQIEPITWDFVGLDSNKPGSQGPNTYVVGARVCNISSNDAINVKAKFNKDGIDNGYTFIRLQGGDTYTFSRLPANISSNQVGIRQTTGQLNYVFDTTANGSLYKTKYQINYTPINCQDFYYNFEVTRTLAAHHTYQRYYIETWADNATRKVTPRPRQIYIEQMISQARNSVLSFTCKGFPGSVNVEVGEEFECIMNAYTSTAYPQLTTTSDIPNVIFQVLDVNTTYSNPGGSKNSTVYADGCGWVQNPTDPRYHNVSLQCDGETGGNGEQYTDQYPFPSTKGGTGNAITTKYKLKVIAFPGNLGLSNTVQVSNIILDNSGGSYHYNADYGIGANVINITVDEPLPTDLSVTKTHSDPFGYGNKTYTLTVSDDNNTPDSAAKSPVTLTDTLPAGYTFVDQNPSKVGIQPLSGTDAANWNCTVSGQVLSCLYDTNGDGFGENFPDNTTNTLTLNVNIAEGAVPSGTTSTNFVQVALNTAVQNDSNPDNNTASDPTTVLQGVDIILSKDDNVDDPTEETFNAGSTAIYRITASNNSGTNANGPLTLVDTLPIGFSFTGTYSGSGWTCNPTDVTGSVVICTSSSGLNDGQSTTVSLTVNVRQSAEDMNPSVVGIQAINTATISSTSNEINYANNTATQTNDVSKPAPDLVVSKTDNNIEFIYDSNSPVTSSYFITVTNKTGANVISTTGPITVVDTLPAQLDPAVLSPLSAGDPTGLTQGWSCTYNATNRQITCINNNPLAPGASSIIEVKVRPNVDPGASPATLNVINTVRVDTPGEINTDDGNFTTSGDNDSQDTTVIRREVRSVDLGVSKSDNEVEPNPLGTAPATVTYTMDITTGTPGNYQVDSGLFEDNIPSGVNVTAATCTRTAQGASGGSFTKCCNGYGANGAPGGGDDIIAPTTDGTAVNIFGNYNSTTRKLVCNGYAMAKSATLRIAVTGTINESGQFFNTVNVSPGNDTLGAAIQDRDPTNNFSSELTTVTGVDLSLTKTVLESAPYKVGDIINYRLAVKNESTTTASSGTMTVVDPLPTNVEYLNAGSASGSSGWSCGHNDATNTVTCVSQTGLSAGQTSSIDITVRLLGSGTIANGNTFRGLSNISNVARVGSGGATANRTVTITTSSAHGYLVGDRVLVDASNNTFDGTFTIETVPTTTTFTYTQGAAAVASVPATGTVNLLTQDARQIVKLIKIGDPIITNNASNASITVLAPDVDLQITKVAQTAPFSIGQTEAYRLTVKNLGTTTAFSPLTIVDELPAGLTFQYANTVPAASLASPAIETPWSCSPSGQTVTCTNYSNLAANTTTGVDLYVQVANTASGNVTNQALVSSSSDICTEFANDANCDDDNATNPAVNKNGLRYDNKTSITTAIATLSDLGITKTATDQDTITAGIQVTENEPATYTITVTNNGPSNYTGNVVIDEFLPTTLSYISHSNSTTWTCNNGTCTTGDKNLTFTKTGGLQAGQSSTITLNVLVGNSTQGTNITNTASINATTLSNAGDPTGDTNDTDDETVTVLDDTSNLVLVKDDNDGETPDEPTTATLQTKFVQGGQGKYTLVVTNNGPASAKKPVKITENTTLPTGLTYAGYSLTTNWKCTGTINGNGSDLDCRYGLWSDTNSDGDRFNDVNGFTELDLPANTTSGVEILVNVGNSAPLSTLSSGIYTGLITNTGKVTSVNNTTGATATEQTAIIQPIDLSVTKTIGSLSAGGTGTYAIVVENKDNNLSDGITIGNAESEIYVTDYLPTGLTYTGYTSDGSWSFVNYNDTTNQVTFKRASGLNVNSSSTINVNVNVDANAPATVRNLVRVTGTSPEVDNPNTAVCDRDFSTQPVNNCYVLPSTVTGGAATDIEVIKKHPSTDSSNGVNDVNFYQNPTDEFSYTIQVQNNSSTDSDPNTTLNAEQVTLIDPLPPSLQFVSVSIASGDNLSINAYGTGTDVTRTCGLESISNRVVCNLHRVSTSENNTDPIDITVTVRALVSGVIPNTATVTTTTADSNTTNNSESESVNVINPPTGKNIISGTVFADQNNNGSYNNPPETITSGVTVQLYRDNGSINGQYDINDTLIATTTTSATDNGASNYENYSFTLNLQGTYIIKVDETTLPQPLSSNSATQHIATFSSLGNSDVNNDFGHQVAAITTDFGDAPDTYSTDKTAGNATGGTDLIGPSHTISTNLFMGTNATDAEVDAATPLDGTGDDANTDDEDGVTFNTLKAGDTSYSVTVKVTNNTGSNAYLVGWIDFNKNGTFEATEGVVASPNIATGTTGADVTLNWTGLSGITAGDTYARFRLSTDTLTTADFAGAKGVGEVEDYKLTITGISNPNVLLVKRITSINGDTIQRTGGDAMTIYNNQTATFRPPNYPYDDNTLDSPAPNPLDTQYWPDPNTFLIGAIDGGEVDPGDTVDYTIYFLSAGTADAKNTLLCDRLPSDTEFQYDTYGTGKGIQLHYDLDGTGPIEDTNLTNVGDTDQGRYFPPTIEPITVYPSINCGGPNTNGAVVVKLGVNDLDVDSPADPIDTLLPKAIASGTPKTSYGYVRFRAKFKN